MSGPLPPSLAPVSGLLSWMYGSAVRLRNMTFAGGRRSKSVTRPVISVGNLTAGGVGKTPVVQWIARTLIDAGHHPVIALRGYGAKKPEDSDEAREHALVLDGKAHVLANPKRHAALSEFLPEHPEVDAVILDDGFQHRMLARDLDIVLIDATRETLGDRMLPAGWLREPARNLARADAVVITHADEVDPVLAARVEAVAGSKPIAWTRHVWRGLDVWAWDGRALSLTRQPVTWLEHRNVMTLFGVGNPEAVIQTVGNHGARIARRIAARDHAAYDKSMVHRLSLQAHGCDALVVTRKDWVKLKGVVDSGQLPIPIVVPDLAIEVIAGAEAWRDQLLETVRGHA